LTPTTALLRCAAGIRSPHGHLQPLVGKTGKVKRAAPQRRHLEAYRLHADQIKQQSAEFPQRVARRPSGDAVEVMSASAT
jgi:hypothetical protein